MTVRAAGSIRAGPISRALRLLLFPIIVAATCANEPQGPELATETYIEVMVALRKAQTLETTPEEFEARRREILAEAGATDSLLVQWARARGHDVEFMAEVWDSINRRLVIRPDSVE